MPTPQEIQAAAKAKLQTSQMIGASATGTSAIVEADKIKVPVAKVIPIDKESTDPTKVYYAKVPNSKYIFSDGVEAFFTHGRLEIGPRSCPGVYEKAQVPNQPESRDNGSERWKIYQRELDAICPPLGNNPMIFKADVIPANLPVPTQNAVSEIELATAESGMLNKNVQISQQIGEISAGAGLPTNADASTLDPELLKAAQNANTSVLGNNNITPVNPEDLQTGNMMNSAS